ncbi:hypothetical protein [Rhodococcus qingshengii]|uniref:hypothetical protein n=1 Tax=Rhodococcus qingshengii TaxID=334542 RepID=UPI001ADFACE0|nr:hypothetical protein [Rhodococcus qingshengii]
MSDMKAVLGFIAAFLLIVFVTNYWQTMLWILLWVVIAAFVIPMTYEGFKFVREYRADMRKVKTDYYKGLDERTNLQHQQYLAGRDEGVYGDYPPAKLN